jgi:hypothetical protein
MEATRNNLLQRTLLLRWGILLAIMLSISFLVNAQDPDDEEPLLEPIKIERYYYFGGNTGFMNLFAELHNDINPSVPERLGGQIYFHYGLSPSLALGLAVTNGRVFGQIRSDGSDELFTNLNVKTTLFAPQLRVVYNGGGLYRYRLPGVFQPWVYTGVELLFFNPLGDITNAEGRPYYYWTDGEIRDLPETPENAGSAIFMERDYFYETILRDADLDGFGGYPRATLSIPIGLGIDINLGHSLSLTIGGSFHYTFTDHLDDITLNSGVLDPKRSIGNRRNDAFMLVHAGITFKYYQTRPVQRVSLVVPAPPPPAPLPFDFIPFDLNGDQVIQREEVLKAINDLFNGESDFDTELIELLVDFYNVQQTTREKIRY